MTPATKTLIIALLKRPIAYHPVLAELSGSITAGILLSQLIYWSDRGHSDDGWIYKKDWDLRHETAMTRHELLSARRRLVDANLLMTQKRGWPPILWYMINWEHLENLLMDR
jgi:hypothetical protein